MRKKSIIQAEQQGHTRSELKQPETMHRLQSACQQGPEKNECLSEQSAASSHFGGQILSGNEKLDGAVAAKHKGRDQVLEVDGSEANAKITHNHTGGGQYSHAHALFSDLPPESVAPGITSSGFRLDTPKAGETRCASMENRPSRQDEKSPAHGAIRYMIKTEKDVAALRTAMEAKVRHCWPIVMMYWASSDISIVVMADRINGISPSAAGVCPRP